MSILIKGVEMPTRCFSCPLCDVENAEVNCAISHGFYIEYREVDPKVAMQDRPEWCPLVPVPPHGRLIDADELIDDVRRHSESYFADDFAHEWVDKAPTVIPADKDGEA